MKPPTVVPTGEPRLIERVGLGSWVLTFAEDGTSEWAKVHMVLSGTQPVTGRKVTRLRAVTTDGGLVEVADFNNETVRHLPAAAGKRAGLTVPEPT